MPDQGGAAEGIMIRPVERTDRDVLLAWRNDPSAHRYYEHPHPVSPENHDRWLDDRLALDPPALWLAWSGATPLGSVRMDLDHQGAAELSIVVDAEYRGRGTGATLLAWAVEVAPTLGVHTIIARVRPENLSSRRLFEAAGYEQGGVDDTGFVRYQLVVPAG